MATANAALHNLGPQPDFDLLEQGARELGKIRNLPAVTQGQVIVDAITQLGADFNAKVTQNHNHVTQ